MTHLVLFEDALASRFLPLVWTRPLWDLRCGVLTVREAIERAYGVEASALFVRDYLVEVVREQGSALVNRFPERGMVLLLNGRLLADSQLPRSIPMFGDACRYVDRDGKLLGAWAPAGDLQAAWPDVTNLPEREVDWLSLQWPWELFQRNGERITQQSVAWPLGEQPPLTGVYLVEPEGIYIHPTARVQPSVVLDASMGPVIIDEGAIVMANAVIQGPGYVGRGSSVKVGAKIYHGTTIGPVCKIGGEVEETIFHGFSNKQHDGFLGHSYIGEWCNFGADTNNSDLKNNYSSVSVWCDGTWRDTRSLFVGLFMGDHSKTGINSMLNSGTVVGVSCNIYGAGLPPKHLPSFTWGSPGAWTEYQLDKAIDTADRVLSRREMRLTPAARALLHYIHETTGPERATL